MKKIKNLAINGFGRIGRAAFKIALQDKALKVLAINDLTDIRILAHLLQYDSIFGEYNAKITYTKNFLVVNNKKIPVFNEKDPAKLKWKKLKIDTVLECTGIFRDSASAKAHLRAGAKKVIISAPPKSDDIKNIVLGVNFADYNPKKDKIISCASCTTNCMSPIAKILNDNFKIKNGFANTIHSYTSDQRLVDAPHSDLRRARAAAINIIPTTTGSAKAVGKVIPELNGKLDAISYRVPTPCVSVVELVVNLEKETSKQELIELFKKNAKKEMMGIIKVEEKELVSGDYVGDPYSATIDANLINVIDKTMVKIVAWYDNEWGYSNRLVELAKII